MNARDDEVILDELSPLLMDAVKQVRGTSVPINSQQRSVRTAKRIARRATRRRRYPRLALAVCASAAGILLLLSLLNVVGSAAAWADVVKAVGERPWIHAVSEVPGETNRLHVWYSPSKRIVASNIGVLAGYADLRTRIQYKYEASTNTVYRLPLDDAVEKEYIRTLAVWDALFRGDEISAAPLGDMQITRQSKRTTVDGDHMWTEYELVLQDAPETPPVRCVIRVDPNTHLPNSANFEGESLGPDLGKIVFKYDYPKEGPTNIFDTGVPEHAVEIDLVPSPELDKLAKSVASVRNGFDAYHALVIESGVKQRWWEAEAVYRVWKSGDRWRVERTTEMEKETLKSLGQPTAKEDPAKWWQKAAANLSFGLIFVCDGQHRYFLTGDSHHQHGIDQWKQGPPSLLPTAMPAGPELPWRMMPELMAYPVFGVPSTDFQPTLERKHTDGPQGTVRLTLRWTKPISSNKFDSRTFWIDPARGYVTLQWETRPEDHNPEDPQRHRYYLEGLAQTPGKLWYPTLIRWNVDGRPAKVVRYYCTFNGAMPARLFQVPGATDR